MTIISAHRLAAAFVDVADTLIDEFDLLEFLHMVAERTASLVGAASVGLLLADERGALEFVAASDENTALLELFAMQTREGPCLDAFRTGQPVIDVRLGDAADRWPRFAPRATAAGFTAVHALPLRLRRQVIGALNVFGSPAGGTFDPADVPVIQALADVAAIGLLQERTIRRGEILSEQLQGALNSRIVIEQAKGAVAQAHGVSVDEAFVVLRAHARRHNRRLTDVARLVVTDPAALRALTP
ncbi:GAF and ANTAR domain-containing protein [Spirilliplanes yamanashiensis]|uniref:Transcriptional regulator n=1 Tax=Spirilliplanes yamanashiensis TaxID=42233 RepID=A0A8J3Y850_9ACTN|nr:GAF and ANTAR domain-containing protein [Spirilliplanes yamanashiensis]MDP9817326.1 GAF domain-containing protein [Spirilliplanes yamanashiensis]GIJ03023.1 transcriptional regulator [Spirilliplanes yamanashiensis]